MEQQAPVPFPHAREKMAELLPEADLFSSHARLFRCPPLQKIRHLKSPLFFVDKLIERNLQCVCEFFEGFE